MTKIKYVSVFEYDDGERDIKPGEAAPSGSHLEMPTPENDVECFARRSWERVGVFTLPEEMSKSEFKDWWNEHKDDDPQPSPIPEVLKTVNADERVEAEAAGGGQA